MTTTASQLIGDPTGSSHYQNAMIELRRELQRPGIQKRVFSYAKASPTELVRARLSTSEIQHRALSYLPDEILSNVPENENVYSLFQGFQATLPEAEESEHRKKHRRHNLKGQKLLEDLDDEKKSPLEKAKDQRHGLDHKLEMMGIRKNMCSAEIREIDNKIVNLNSMRSIVLDRLESLEQDELRMEQELMEVDNKIGDLLEDLDAQESSSGARTPQAEAKLASEPVDSDDKDMDESFMSASIYEKLPSPKNKRQKPSRRRSAAIRHEHFEPGSKLKEMQAHNDMITSLDFDVPFGTMVTSALDDTVRVWDLNLGRCIGMLEGHQASVRCLQMEDSIVATGSMDASIRLWDLSLAEYSAAKGVNATILEDDEEDGEDRSTLDERERRTSSSSQSRGSNMSECSLISLTAHVAEVTALHLQGDTLVSGSADKTLRQWDLVKGRCVQTLDVLWAAAQASATINPVSGDSSNPMPSGSSQWRNPGSRNLDASADFVGALQCFDAALACGTADGMVRLWDLRSGQVHRSLVGHTGAVTCLQFDETALVTGSADRSIRVCDNLLFLVSSFSEILTRPRYGTSEQALSSMHMLTIVRSLA